MYQAFSLLLLLIFECIKRFYYFLGGFSIVSSVFNIFLMNFRDLETRDRGPRTGDQGPGTGNRKPETGDRGPGTGDRRPGTGDRRPDAGHRGPYVYLKLSGNTDLGDMQQFIRIAPQGHGFEKKTRLAAGDFFFQNTVHSGCFARFAMGSRKHVLEPISRCPGRFLSPLGTILKSVDRLWGVLGRPRQRLGACWTWFWRFLGTVWSVSSLCVRLSL